MCVGSAWAVLAHLTFQKCRNSAEQLVDVTMGVTNGQKVEENVVKNATVNQ